MEHFSAEFRRRFEKDEVLDGIEKMMERLVDLRRQRLDVPA